jgi:uncharacterized membrane protein
MSNVFLFSLPGGGEWLVILFGLLFLIISPVLAIVYYLEAKRLRKENKELMERLMNQQS